MNAFRDTAPQHWGREPTRQECAAADEAEAQSVAAQRGGECFDLTDDLGRLLDKRAADWRADDQMLLDRIHALLSEAKAHAGRLGR
jgi:hypothetical protein